MSSDSSTNNSALHRTPANGFTNGPLGALFAKTALPIVFVMSMNGLLSVVDAIFLGIYVGPNALSAVTLMFPIYMLVVALSTLVAGGMSSILARHLGAGLTTDARNIFASAHGLAITLSLVLIIAFLFIGHQVTFLVAGGVEELASMGHTYLAITIFSTPMLFVLSVHSDALRNEGFAMMMAGMSLLVSLANILFNYILIAQFDMGVAGSAYGTVMAQTLALTIILLFRIFGPSKLKPCHLLHSPPLANWRPILALGAPQSLNFLGMALGSTATITALQMAATPHYAQTIAAYGIVTRIMTFVFLPLLGLSFALQSITGNNYGASLWHRSDNSLRIGVTISLVYCLLAQLILTTAAAPIGRMFVDNEMVVGEVARIAPIIVTLMFSVGPLLMIATYFQAIGDAPRAAILSLSKSYLFVLPLIFVLPLQFGETGIWLAAPIADLFLITTTLILLTYTARQTQRKWGLFATPKEVQS